MKDIRELIEKWKEKKPEIRNRLQEFREVFNQDDQRIFAELAFCLCTPQSKATSAWSAITSLVKNGYLYSGSENLIKPFLNAVRFGENKSKYIVEARKIFTVNGKLQIKSKLQLADHAKLREWLAENVKGFGMKEASHFLRNIGLGEDLAILDVHILKNLQDYGVIDEIPEVLTKKTYLEIESKMKKFSEQIGIPFAELDLLLWSEETGMIFK